MDRETVSVKCDKSLKIFICCKEWTRHGRPCNAQKKLLQSPLESEISTTPIFFHVSYNFSASFSISKFIPVYYSHFPIFNGYVLLPVKTLSKNNIQIAPCFTLLECSERKHCSSCHFPTTFFSFTDLHKQQAKQASHPFATHTNKQPTKGSYRNEHKDRKTIVPIGAFNVTNLSTSAHCIKTA